MKLSTCKKPFAYNMLFNEHTGWTARWGATEDDDPQWAPPGPELADIEVSTICHGGCQHCYKSNTATGKNMSLAKYQEIISHLGKNLCQVALGIGDFKANEDLPEILRWSRKQDIIPNITIRSNDVLDNGDIHVLAKECGAVAISFYNAEGVRDKVEALKEAGLKQINIHYMLSSETIDLAYFAMGMAKSLDINAIVFLTYKPAGRGLQSTHQPVTKDQFKELTDFAITHNIRFGFDSCAAHNFLSTCSLKGMEKYAEPCESTLFSIYINVDGYIWPCSFCEHKLNWNELPVTKEFLNWWRGIIPFRENLLKNDRKCPVYELELK